MVVINLKSGVNVFILSMICVTQQHTQTQHRNVNMRSKHGQTLNTMINVICECIYSEFFKFYFTFIHQYNSFT